MEEKSGFSFLDFYFKNIFDERIQNVYMLKILGYVLYLNVKKKSHPVHMILTSRQKVRRVVWYKYL